MSNEVNHLAFPLTHKSAMDDCSEQELIESYENKLGGPIENLTTLSPDVLQGGNR